MHRARALHDPRHIGADAVRATVPRMCLTALARLAAAAVVSLVLASSAHAAPPQRGPDLPRGADTVAPTAPAPKEKLFDIDYSFDVRIRMRDGVELSALLYRPAGVKERVPVVFMRTPYIADAYHKYGTYFAARGYAVAIVDARGRGNSQGVFHPAEDDGPDGYDIVEWLARQPWSTGKVGMFGGSYAGFTQWATLKQFPPHLATIVPVASVGWGIDFPMYRNISYPYVMRWLSFVSRLTKNEGFFTDDKMWKPWEELLFRGVQPFAALDRLAGNPSETFQKWLAHPSYDAYWRGIAPSPEDYAKIRIPILTITGHYDGDQPGALHYYDGHMRHGQKQTTAQHYLVIGPWDHAGTRTPKPVVGGLELGPDSLVDVMDLHKQWYDFTLRGGSRPKFLQKRVAYYVTESEDWRHADELGKVVAGEPRLFHLSSTGSASDVVHSGTLGPVPGSGSDSYVVDPLDLRFLERDALRSADNWVVDSLGASPPPGAALVYHSPPFERDTDLGGFAQATLYLSMDVPDTDIHVALYELRPDGRTVLLCDDQLRARYRESSEIARLVEPGKILPYRFDRFGFFARTIRKGSRLRLTVGPVLGTGGQNNRQSGGVVAEETARDARTATIRLHHDAEHASALRLHVVQKPEAPRPKPAPPPGKATK